MGEEEVTESVLTQITEGGARLVRRSRRSEDGGTERRPGTWNRVGRVTDGVKLNYMEKYSYIREGKLGLVNLLGRSNVSDGQIL